MKDSLENLGVLQAFVLLLVGNLQLTFQLIKPLNPATSLSTELSLPDHGSLNLTDELFTRWSDLWMEPLSNAEYTLFMNGSSLGRGGKHQASYAVSTAEEVLLTGPLPQK